MPFQAPDPVSRGTSIFLSIFFIFIYIFIGIFFGASFFGARIYGESMGHPLFISLYRQEMNIDFLLQFSS
jgi:hypothetical protein